MEGGASHKHRKERGTWGEEGWVLYTELITALP